jgi:hypothetical protein
MLRERRAVLTLEQPGHGTGPAEIHTGLTDTDAPHADRREVH